MPRLSRGDASAIEQHKIRAQMDNKVVEIEACFMMCVCIYREREKESKGVEMKWNEYIGLRSTLFQFYVIEFFFL